MELHTYLEGMDRLSAPRKSIPVTKCDICDVDLAVSSLQRHKKIVHKLNIGKQIQCPECEKLFQSKDRLIMHLAKSHGLSTPDYTLYSIQCFPFPHHFNQWQCQIKCFFCTGSSSSLNSNKIIHNLPKLYIFRVIGQD